jgi:hypothetical protein
MKLLPSLVALVLVSTPGLSGCLAPYSSVNEEAEGELREFYSDGERAELRKRKVERRLAAERALEERRREKSAAELSAKLRREAARHTARLNGVTARLNVVEPEAGGGGE